MRINKYLASCGIASRRASEQLILDKKVSVNGEIITDLATDIDEVQDRVVLEGKEIKLVRKKVYYLLNKPKGYISSVKDDKGRRTIMQLVKSTERVFPIGRLDYNTEGLIILTNDGDLANKLMHPSSEVEKTYIANIRGDVKESELAVLRNGVILDGIPTAKARMKKMKYEKGVTRVQIIIHEGRNRQIRRMFDEIGKEILYLKRTAIGTIKLGGMSRKEFRHLTDAEVVMLKTI
jgi:23S rRNA pseudouridine2605 synthase